MLEDVDIENLCSSYVFIHSICHKLWFHKIKLLYSDFSFLNFTSTEYKALYYKLKYNKWSDIVVYSELNDIKLSQWIIDNKSYNTYVKNTIGKYLSSINIARYKRIKIPLAIYLFKFIFTHRQLIYTDKWLKFRNCIKPKLIYLKDTEPVLDGLPAPEYYNVFDLYIKFL